jgi:lipoic acid synthetase
MSPPTTRDIPLQVVTSDASPPQPAALQPGAKQLAGDKIARSPVQFADASIASATS